MHSLTGRIHTLNAVVCATDGQSVEAQVRQLRAAGARKVFLARSTRDLLNTLAAITATKAGFNRASSAAPSRES
jgi:hypothetical protein